jgi:K+-sensing histidine kinase KdpD
MSPTEAFSTSIFFHSTPRPYAAAVGATLFALLIAAAMIPVAGGYAVYLVLPAAVAFSAVYCGLGPSVVAIAVALFGVRYWFINPSHSLSIPDGQKSIGIVAFVVVSAVVVAFG